jgi:hypothetical protein
MQARIVITAALAALALAVPTAQARMEDSNGAGSEPTASSVAHPRPDDRGGVRGVGTDTGFAPGVTDLATVRVDTRGGVDGAPAPSGIDWRELGFSGAAVLALIALFVTRMRSRQNDATKPATLSG